MFFMLMDMKYGMILKRILDLPCDILYLFDVVDNKHVNMLCTP